MLVVVPIFTLIISYNVLIINNYVLFDYVKFLALTVFSSVRASFARDRSPNVVSKARSDRSRATRLQTID